MRRGFRRGGAVFFGRCPGAARMLSESRPADARQLFRQRRTLRDRASASASARSRDRSAHRTDTYPTMHAAHPHPHQTFSPKSISTLFTRRFAS
ncbi:hypothetical protein WS83_21310 [Burkholderia sp. MSMB2042]|nr:hypothetical protein WS78_27545 [Burkholderia savannae]KVG89644.1 hypothetical protein WS81_21645 [Burkholderia sp. MSMB2040]KVH00878.1 hypothetical protein WS83_21310 [Burkholderia sp. MSMB2042]